MPRSIALYLQDILDSIANITEYIGSLTFNEFLANKKTQDAVIRNLEIIGEAVKNLPVEIKSKYFYNWREIAGLRDILIHQYSGVSLNIVWDIFENELSSLQNVIKTILDEQND